MKEIKFFYSNNLIPEIEIYNIEKKLMKEIKQMNYSLENGYNDDYASLNLIDDKEHILKIKKIINNKLELKPKYLVVVGIGGSNLGAIAVQEAVLGRLYNITSSGLKILYADTVDSDLIFDIISIIENDLKKGENIIINAISKSGSTTETIANFEVLIDIVKKYKEKYEKYVVVTTDRGSKLWDLAVNKGFTTLEIPKKVGGRFSVFSSVGLFPLGMLGIDIDQLLKGAKKMRNKCLKRDIKFNPAALSAYFIYYHRLKGVNINDLFLFSPDLESIGKWYRQLIGESIGKEFDKKNNRIFEGITPTVSIGSTDLHSMAQLYLGGPYDKFTSFVKINNNRNDIEIPNYSEYDYLVQGIQSKMLNQVMDAIYSGVKRAFIKSKRPFIEIILPDKSAYSIGQFLQLKEIEAIYLGYLLNVNPFDQPNVENYKIETKKILDNNT